MSQYAIIVQNDESQWDDIKGELYQYPSTYKSILTKGCQIIYYKGSLKNKKYEKERLESLGCKDLADKINHVSVKEGDGAGYDIESFEEDGSIRYIEVKTTKGGINTAFFISNNEVQRSRITENYYLYRVYNYELDTNTGKLYTKRAPIEDSFELFPVNYKAVPINTQKTD